MNSYKRPLATAVVILGGLIVAGCVALGSTPVPEAPTATPTLIPSTPKPVPPTSTPAPTPTAAAETDSRISAPIDLELTQTHLFPDFGFSLDYPSGWFAQTRNNLTILTQFEEDQERVVTSGSAALGYYLTMDHTDIERLYRLGLPKNPTLGDLLQFNIIFLGMPQPKTVSEATVFGVPAIRAKAGNEDQWAITYLGIKDDRFFLLVMSGPSEEALDAFGPTWTKMLQSIQPLAATEGTSQ